MCKMQIIALLPIITIIDCSGCTPISPAAYSDDAALARVRSYHPWSVESDRGRKAPLKNGGAGYPG